MQNVQKTLAVWWRFGKEHGEDNGFRVNDHTIVEQHLNSKVAQHSGTPADQWRWWIADNLIVERPALSQYYGPETRIYYLVEQGLTVIEQINLPPPREQWYWYIHLADIFYDQARQCWINKDLFCDVVLDPTGERYHLMDLDDLGEALTIDLIDNREAAHILRRTEQTLNAITEGGFPFPEIEQAQALCRQLGW